MRIGVDFDDDVVLHTGLSSRCVSWVSSCSKVLRIACFCAHVKV